MTDAQPLLIDPPPSRPSHWDAVQRIMRRLKDAFVNPYQLLRNGFRDGWMAHGFFTIVRAAETEARRGLLCDALAIVPTLAPPAPRVRAAPSASRARAPSCDRPLEENFRAWRVHFPLAPRKLSAGPRRHDSASGQRRRAELKRRHDEFWFGPYGAPRPDYKLLDVMKRTSLRACALRFEAVRRVMENPAPYALRLARRLRAQTSRALADAVLGPEPAFEYDHHAEQAAHCGPRIDALWPSPIRDSS